MPVKKDGNKSVNTVKEGSDHIDIHCNNIENNNADRNNHVSDDG